MVYKVDPFKLSHISLTKYLVCISVAAQVCLIFCFLKEIALLVEKYKQMSFFMFSFIS